MSVQVVCMRAEDMPEPAVPSQQDRCSKCQATVWVAVNLVETGEQIAPVCWTCYRTVPDSVAGTMSFRGEEIDALLSMCGSRHEAITFLVWLMVTGGSDENVSDVLLGLAQDPESDESKSLRAAIPRATAIVDRAMARRAN